MSFKANGIETAGTDQEIESSSKLLGRWLGVKRLNIEIIEKT